MKRFSLAAASVSMLLSAAAASAQGLPPGTTAPVYGSHAFDASRRTAAAPGAQDPGVMASKAAQGVDRNATSSARANPSPFGHAPRESRD